MRTLAARAVLALTLALIATAEPVSAHEFKQGGLVIIHPHTVEPADETAKSAAVFMTIRNTTDQTDRLIAVAQPLSARAMLVRTSPDRRETTPVNAIELAPRSQTTLGPNSVHIVLEDLKVPLYGYASFSLTLTFELAGTIEVDVLVEEK